MMRSHFAWKGILVHLVPLLLLAASCASVPKGASEANETVSEGIRRLRDQHIETIRAFGDSVRASIQSVWEEEIIFKTIEEVGKRDANGDYSSEDIADIAATAAEVRDNLLYEVNVKEDELIESTQRNYNGLIQMNDVVTGYLASLEELDSAQQALQQRMLGTVGIESNEVPTVVKDLLNIAEDPAAALAPEGTKGEGTKKPVAPAPANPTNPNTNDAEIK